MTMANPTTYIDYCRSLQRPGSMSHTDDHIRTERFLRLADFEGSKIRWTEKTTPCAYHRSIYPQCLYCNRVFVNNNALIHHLMLTRRNRNLGLLKAMHPSSAPATSKIVMQTVTLDLDMSISERIFPTELTNFGPSNPMCSPNWHDLAIKKFSESGPIETEPENDRSTVPPDMWTLYPFVLDFLFSSKTDNGLGNNRLKSCDNRAPQGNNNVQMTNRYDQHAEQVIIVASEFQQCVEEFSKEKLEQSLKNILIGQSGDKIELCLFTSDASSTCSFCEARFDNSDVLTHHLLFTHCNPYMTLKNPLEYREYLISKYPPGTISQDDLIRTERLARFFDTFNPNLVPNPSTAMGHNHEYEFAEGGPTKTEPENDRSTLTPNMSNMWPFNPNLVPNPSTAVGHNHAEYEFAGTQRFPTSHSRFANSRY